eukprot:2570035-Prorocentrum_lima.AAC.1
MISRTWHQRRILLALQYSIFNSKPKNPKEGSQVPKSRSDWPGARRWAGSVDTVPVDSTVRRT